MNFENISFTLDNVDRAIAALDCNRSPLENYEALVNLIDEILNLGIAVNLDADKGDVSLLQDRLHAQAETLKPVLYLIYYYINRFDQSLWGGWKGSWLRLCRKRSGFAFLQELYKGTVLTTGEDALEDDEFEDIDTNLRLIYKEEGGVASENIPEGIPESHWWWF